jgi:Ca-activated chloride channel family protein
VIERFAHPTDLVWLYACVAIALLAALSLYRSRRVASIAFDAATRARMLPQRTAWRPIFRSVLVVLASASLVLALARPPANPTPTDVARQGRDLCVIIDISNSMLAEDIRPNRLERSKLWIRDLIRSLASDRVAVIAMAGTPRVAVPLTTDYGFAQLAIDQLRTTDAVRGGTNLGDAIRLAVDDVFDQKDARFRDIILITDGEDLEGSFPIEAAAEAGELGFRIITIGLGSTQGSTVPITDPQTGTKTLLVDEKGDAVVTRLDADTLLDIARASANGRFYNVGTGDIRLDRVYAALVDESERRAFEAAETLLYDELYWIFAGLALAFLSLEYTTANRKLNAPV